MPLATGATFAGYTILRLLGTGGMGEVYLAQHPRLPRRDALKILGSHVSADDDYRRRFISEADLAAALWHPNIVRVNDRGEFNGRLWISMDFVDGTDAASLLRDRYPVGMPADQVATIIAAIASALDYAHQHDLLHRDVKPANILLSKPGDGDQRILLGDFGIARTTGDTCGLTATNMTIGTFPYAAPEQLTGEPMDGRADQYALAATAYHLLTGSPLFPHTNPAVVISHHLSAPPPTLAKTRPKLTGFDPVLAVALAKGPADRFARCTDFARAFAEAAHSGGHASASASTRPAPLASRPPESTAVPSARAAAAKQQRRRRWRIFAAASTVIALTAVGAIGYTIENNDTASKQASPAAVLDGTYRLDFDFSKQTANGAPDPQPNTGNTDWWAFRSSCRSAGCVATATQLDTNNHQVARTPTDTGMLHFANGHWQDSGSVQHRVPQARCLGANGNVVAGADTQLVAWSLAPQPNGTLEGAVTTTTLTNECGHQGSVLQAPFVATRTGDVPPGVILADPTTVTGALTSSARTPAVAGPKLDGTYRVDSDYAKQTANGAQPTGIAEIISRWWAFRSLCASAGCVAIGSRLADDNQQEATGGVEVLRFVDGHWQDTPYLEAPFQCPGTDTTVARTETDSRTSTISLEPQPDGTLRGIMTRTVLTNECGNQGTVYRTPIVATRTGDVAPSVTVADPALFPSPSVPTK
jgi:serine/threonine protein kinase, bacterial